MCGTQSQQIRYTLDMVLSVSWIDDPSRLVDYDSLAKQ